MNSGNLTRDKYLQIIQLLEQRTREVAQLQSLISSQPTPTDIVIITVDTFRSVLVTAERNNAVWHKGKITSRKHGCVEICYRNFMDFSVQGLQERELDEYLDEYKDSLLTLGFVDAASFSGGGIPSRVEGRTVRVVRIPEPIYTLLTESRGGQREQ